MQLQFVLEHRLCLNEVPLPFVTYKMDLEDLNKLVGGDQEEQDFLFLSIAASAEVRWLEKALEVRVLFWRNNHRDIPLMHEMRQAIDAGKVRKGSRCRAARLVDKVVAVMIRGKIVLLQNKVGLVLVCRPTEEKELLLWFLEELTKDVKRLATVGRACVDAPRKKGGGHQVLIEDDSPEQAIIDNSLSTIRAHSQCHLVTWLPSLTSLKVIKKNNQGEEKFFFLKGYKKKRKLLLEQISLMDGESRQDDRAEGSVRMVFEQAANACIEYLEIATGSSSDLPVPLED
jgi:hypothetical protein